MTRILIAYGSSEGHTASIAQYLADLIRSHGHEAKPVNVERAEAGAPDGYDAVIVGASVHMGKHQRSVLKYVRQNRDSLTRLPSAFFSVSLAANDNTEEARKEVASYIEQFLEQTGWRPLVIGRFAGALLYTRYSFFKRWIMRKIARDKKSPDTDSSRDYVYTDWHRVRRFADEFMESVALASSTAVMNSWTVAQYPEAELVGKAR
jgi:menaquinone-dependent protoporphyrinogen oxidase